MAYAPVAFTSTGTAAPIAIPWTYQDVADVSILVNELPYAGTATWLSPTLLQLVPYPASGVAVVVARTTPTDEPAHTFAGGPIVSSDLNANQTQDLNRLEELAEGLGRSIQVLPGDTAPTYAQLHDLLKGDPGGTFLAIGLFSAAPFLAIPVGTDAIRTSGHTVKNFGSAFYVADTTVDSVYVAANPLTSFMSANGRGFKLDVGACDISQFGAIGANATQDTAAIQAGLNRAGYLMAAHAGINGDYLLGASLVVPSETFFDIWPGVTITQAAGVNLNLIHNGCYAAAWNNITGGNLVWLADPYTVEIGFIAHGLAVGDFVWLDNTDAAQYNGVFQVLVVESVDKVIVKLDARPLANPTGTSRFKKANHNITIRGGIWNYNKTQNGDMTQGPSTHTALFAGVDGLYFTPEGFLDQKKFAICLGGVTNFHVGATCFLTASDGLKVYGPSWNGTVALRGYSKDDMMSCQPQEVLADAAYRFSQGNVHSIKASVYLVEGDINLTVGCSLYPTSWGGAVIDDLDLDLRGETNFRAMQIKAQDTTFVGSSAGTIGHVRVRLAMSCPQPVLITQDALAQATPVSIKQLDIDLQGVVATTGGNIIETGVGTYLDTLKLTGTVNNAAASAGTIVSFVGDVRRIVLDGLVYKTAGSYGLAFSGATKTLECIDILNPDIAVAVTFFRADNVIMSQTPRISVHGGYLSGASSLFDVCSSMYLDFVSVGVKPTSGQVVRGYLKSGGEANPAVHLSSHGSVLLAGDWAVSSAMATGFVLHPRSEELILNLNDTHIGRATGNRLTTNSQTGSGGSTDIQTGAMAFCQGTSSGSWHQATDPVNRVF